MSTFGCSLLYSENHFEYIGYGKVAPAPLIRCCCAATPVTRAQAAATAMESLLNLFMGLSLLEIDQSVQRDGVHRGGNDVVEHLAVVVQHDRGGDATLVREPVRHTVDP